MNAYQDQFIKPEIKVSNNVFKDHITKHKCAAELKRRTAIPYTYTTRRRRNTDHANDRSRKKNSKKTSSGKIRNQSDNEWKDFEADG